ncbi:hypothetical protein PIB30_056374 [Stylosanthes scabra]|uniref:Uncharacterized protein n=1 Tax=Stylosanthes scabra TaxID=79078 RepID=A0ABU6SJB8_9FABA|nr:hypothetical protein [Stylosanthes scabra]
MDSAKTSSDLVRALEEINGRENEQAVLVKMVRSEEGDPLETLVRSDSYEDGEIEDRYVDLEEMFNECKFYKGKGEPRPLVVEGREVFRPLKVIQQSGVVEGKEYSSCSTKGTNCALESLVQKE